MKDIKIVSGFGDKHWGVAIYIDDKLFADDDHDSDFPDEGSAAYKLLKKMAKQSNIQWREITTHICYRLNSYYTPIPKTWKQYEDNILKYYQAHQTFKSVEEFAYTSPPQDDEQRYIEQVFELSGGKNFEKFYPTYLAHFIPLFEEEVWKEYTLSADKYSRNRGDENAWNEHQKSYKKLTELWYQRLEWVWEAPKTPEPYRKLWLSSQK